MVTGAPVRYAVQWSDPGGGVAERELQQGAQVVGRAPNCQLVLPDALASREHARIDVRGDGVMLVDLGSRNGTYVNGERIFSADLSPGDEIGIGNTTLRLVAMGATAPTAMADAGHTIALDIADLATSVPPAAAPPAPATVIVRPPGAVVPDELLRQPVIDPRALLHSGVEVKVAEFAALGAGLGSFCWVDWLRNSGVSAADILVAGVDDVPYARYQRLCSDSQIPAHERLRSNSDSCPDNVWGFPAYAPREAWRELTRGNLGLGLTLLWQVFGEPAIAQTYTPRSGDVFRSIDREMARIGWPSMLHKGRIRAIRKSTDGRLLAVVSESDEQRRRHVVTSGRFMHLAIGYPAIQLLPDLAEYRDKTGDRVRVVNAYEHHPHVYEDLRRNGGTVLIRGRGIVASRVIQRLWEERRNNPNIRIIHLQRSRLTAGHRYGMSRRLLKDQFEFQPFNWPKAGWGGESRQVLERAGDDERKRLLDAWGGTTTARRSDWVRMVGEGVREGWYRAEFGVVKEVRPVDGKRVQTRISSSLQGGGALELAADYVIDCTGLIAAPERSPLLADMMQTYGLQKNKLGRLQVTNDFEITGMRHGAARMYTCGAITLGGPYAPVDSFLGLQYAGLTAMDAMMRESPPPKGLRRLDGLYSFAQWLKWVRGVAP
ncbi:MAG: FHA domain-containing protein [Dehalococcoidia bacterium]